MRHLGDITQIFGHDVPVVDVVIGGSPCQGLSVAGKGLGLKDDRSALFLEKIRIIKEMREVDARTGRTGQFIRPRFMVWENVPGAFSSNKRQDFWRVLEETIRIAEPDAPDIPLPEKWPLADAWYGDGWSVAYRVLDAQFWGVPQRRRRIAFVADFGGHAAPEILFVRTGVCGDTAESGATGGTGDGAETTAGHCLLFAVQRFGKYIAGNVASALKARDYKGNTDIIVDVYKMIARYRTPLECERLQGYPDGWTDIGPWVDSKGKRHKESSDSARYKALGNSIALPPWAWVLKRLCACYERPATMASLFDGIGGFPLLWERLNGPGSCLWASEIEEFPMAVTKVRFGG